MCIYIYDEEWWRRQALELKCPACISALKWASWVTLGQSLQPLYASVYSSVKWVHGRIHSIQWMHVTCVHTVRVERMQSVVLVVVTRLPYDSPPNVYKTARPPRLPSSFSDASGCACSFSGTVVLPFLLLWVAPSGLKPVLQPRTWTWLSLCCGTSRAGQSQLGLCSRAHGSRTKEL